MAFDMKIFDSIHEWCIHQLRPCHLSAIEVPVYPFNGHRACGYFYLFSRPDAQSLRYHPPCFESFRHAAVALESHPEKIINYMKILHGSDCMEILELIYNVERARLAKGKRIEWKEFVVGKTTT